MHEKAVKAPSLKFFRVIWCFSLLKKAYSNNIVRLQKRFFQEANPDGNGV